VLYKCNERRECIDFEFDGDELRKISPPAAAAAASATLTTAADTALPRHLEIVHEFLNSHKLWDDTNYGCNLYHAINTMLTLGHAVSIARLRAFLLGNHRNDGLPDPAHFRPLRWKSIPAARHVCAACGHHRMVSFEVESEDEAHKGWLMGSSCKRRIEALQALIQYIASVRSTSSTIGMSRHNLASIANKINDLRSRAQAAAASRD